MGFFTAPKHRRPRRFDQVEDEDKRIHLHRLGAYTRPRGRSMLWLVVMIAFIAYLIFYLNHVKG